MIVAAFLKQLARYHAFRTMHLRGKMSVRAGP